MNINDLNDIEYMLNLCGYKLKKDNNTSDNDDNLEPVIDWTDGGKVNCCSNLNLDIPGGFQDVNPLIFIVIGDLLGNILSGNLPFNVAVAVSNWLNLVGQAIETYGAQQQYFQNGPGRVYRPEYKNVGNPSCSCQRVNNSSNNDDLQNEINEIKEQLVKINARIEKLSKDENSSEV